MLESAFYPFASFQFSPTPTSTVSGTASWTAASIRSRIVEKLAWLGVTLDPAGNARHDARISRSDSRIPVYVVPTDEELMIAQHTLALLMNRQSPNQKRERVS